MTETKITQDQKQGQHFIGHKQEAPEFARDNQFIKKGYRINFNTPKKIFRSLFMLHNQTLNIWTHLLAAIIVVFVLGYFLWAYTSETSKQNIKLEIKSKFDSYIDKLNIMNLTASTNEKFIEITQMLKQNYELLSNITSQKMQTANASISNIIVQMEKMFEQSLVKFIEAKQKFQNEGAEQMMEALDHLGDNQTYFQQIKTHIKQFSDKFVEKVDSPMYDFLDFTESPNPGHISRWPVVAMMISAVICLMCSSVFHLFYPMSGKYYMFFARFDYAGINILISGSTLPPLYYGLYCHPALAQFYIICISIVAMTLFSVSLFEFMHTPKFRLLKSICYGSFGIMVSVPLFHMVINEIFFPDGDKFTFLNSLPLFLALGASYLGGLVVYTKRCPERHKPGNFDICGHSHQIWHLTVVLGIFFTYLAALQNFEERKLYPICPS